MLSKFRLGESRMKADYPSWWTYPQEKGAVIFARPNRLRVVLMENFDAMAMLSSMIEHASEVVGAFDRYLGDGIFPKVSR